MLDTTDWACIIQSPVTTMDLNSGPRSLEGMDEEIPLLPEAQRGSRGVLRQTYAVVAACLGTISFGLVVGYSSPTLPDLKSSGVLTEDQATWYGSLITLGAMLGGPFGGFIVDALGRKTSLILTSVPFTLGWLINICTENIWVLYLGRLLTGLATGAICVCAPVYIAEVSSASLRGRFGTCFQVGGCLGILLVYAFGIILDWRWLSVVCATVPAIMAICMLLVPETPRWLLRHGHRTQAKRALAWLRDATSHAEIAREWGELDNGLTSNTAESKLTYYDLLAPSIYKPFAISFVITAIQQFSGINAVLFYTNEIFQTAGFEEDSGTPTVIIGSLLVGVTAASSFVVDRAGRKIMLGISGVLMMLSCSTLGAYYHIGNPSLGWLSLTSLSVYITAFSVGWGPVPFVVISELLPPKGYGVTSGTITAINWCLAFVITKEFSAMEATLSKAGTFWLFGGVCGLGAAFVALFVPETKGRSLQDIALYFE